MKSHSKQGLLLSMLPVLLMHAGSANATPEKVQFVTAAPADTRNFIGDRIEYTAALQVNAVALGSGTTESVCVTPETSLRGIGVTKLKLGTADPTDQVLFVVGSVEADSNRACGNAILAKPGQTVALDPSFLASIPPHRYGWTYGTLIVPYKYQFRGDRSVAGGATLGGYMGYRATVRGSSVAYVAFAGATKVDVAMLKDGKPFTESLAGLSYGVGLLGTIKDGFKAGLVIGTDRVARNAGYVNNGKPWVSLSLGYDFTAN